MTKPLGDTSRRVLVVLAICAQKQHAPTWTEIRKAAKVESNIKFVRVMESLKRKGLVYFVEHELRSTRITPAGLRAAVTR